MTQAGLIALQNDTARACREIRWQRAILEAVSDYAKTVGAPACAGLHDAILWLTEDHKRLKQGR